ncbi:serine hydroxymethyltransferase, partial [Nitrospina sp. 32_T5]
EEALDQAGITVNKNTVPFETRSPFVTSGIRIGTPALTTRGMKENAMKKIGEMIVGVLEHVDDAAYIEKTRKQVRDLCEQYPFHMELSNKY